MQQLVEFIGNHPYLATIWAVLFSLLIYSFVAGALSPLKELTTHQVTRLINREDALVLDIRTSGDYKKGHILGAKQIPSEAVAKADFNKLEKYKHKPIIVVCAMGMTAKKTGTQLLKAGFDSVSVLKGGMSTWQSEGLPINK